MIVGYCRLSRDDNQKNIASIEEQKSIISNYANSKGWAVDIFYADDNYSGYKVDDDDDTVFDRPAFKELWTGVNDGVISKILVKDLSRLGRNSPVVQIIIRRLQKQGVGLILVDENKDIASNEDDMLFIKTWYNEQYVKDISKKTRQSMYNKQKEGRLIMGNHYGYIKEDKSTLVVDEEIRPCIELIYKMYIDGSGYTKIANFLNENTNYPTPSQYYERKHMERGNTYKHKVTDKWQNYHIQNILSTDIYTGILRTHKKQSKSIRGSVERVPEDKHFIFENHHVPMVSMEDWELVQQIKEKRDKNDFRGKAKNEYIFKGFIVCGECGYHVSGVILKRKVNILGYNCNQYIRYGKKICGNKETKEESLLNHFKAFLIDARNTYSEYLASVDFSRKQKDNTKQKEKLEKELANAENELKVLISNKIQDIIKQPEEYKSIVADTYNKLEEEKKSNIVRLKSQIKTLQDLSGKKTEAKIRTAIDVMGEIIASEVPPRKLLETILDKIIFHKDRLIEFKLKVSIDDINSMTQI
jgi:site-specific DNA recombinase